MINSKPRTTLILPIVLALLLHPVTQVAARQSNPVYVDDSPLAREQFNQAVDQMRDNLGESIRLFQDLLDEYPLRLIPADDHTGDRLVSVRTRVLQTIQQNRALLARYQTSEGPAARRMLEADELERLALTRPLTEAGLEALMLLSQQHLEDGRFDAANRWLTEVLDHPSLDDRRRAHAWFMTGLAARYRGDEARLSLAIRMLDELGRSADRLYARLGELAEQELARKPFRSRSVFDRTSSFELAELVAEEIWTVPLAETLFSRLSQDAAIDRPMVARSVQQTRDEGFLITTAPAIAGHVVYINQGHRIMALDRISGTSIWARDYVDRSRVTISDREDQTARDLNTVVIEGDALVTLTGHAYGNNRSNDGRLICLDARSGELRWSRTFRRLDTDDDTPEDLFPHSTPVIADGAVYVMARKVSRQALTSSYIVALDLASGDVRWIRHIASSGSIHRAPRNFSSLVYEDGDLYVASSVGAIARIDAITGQTIWLSRYTVPITPPSHEIYQRPWELTAPLVFEDRVIALQPGQRRIVALDRENGLQLLSVDAASRDTWNAPNYILRGESYIFGVGREIRAFHPDRLDQPVWQLPGWEQSIPGHERNARSVSSSIDILGRVQVAGNTLIVPTAGGILMVREDDGQVFHELPISLVGNPIAMDSQLFVAGHDRLNAYMSLSRAEDLLRQRIVSSPDDPEPAMALTRLALRVGKLGLAMEAAQLTLDSIRLNRSEAVATNAQRALFNLLLSIDARTLDAPKEKVERLFALISNVVATREQRLAHLIVYGDWLALERPDHAIETYQSILTDPELRNLTRVEGEIVRPARSVALDRIANVLEVHGRQRYAAQADFAELRLRQLRRQESRDPRRYIELALEYPFADAAVDASRTAAELLVSQGDSVSATSTLLRHYRDSLIAPDLAADRSESLLGRAIEIHLANEHPKRAAALLRMIREARGDIGISLRLPDGETRLRPVSNWLAMFEPSPQTRPRLGEPAQSARVLEGGLVAPVPGQRDRSRPDEVLLVDEAFLRLKASKDLASRWSYELDSAMPQVLAWDDRRLVLWFGDNPVDPRAVMLDPRDGRFRWMTPRLSDLARDPVRDLRRGRDARETLPDGQPLDLREALPLIAGDVLVTVRRTGEVQAFHPSDGSEPMWQTMQTLSRVHLALATEQTIALLGEAGSDGRHGRSGAARPAAIILDTGTGRPLTKEPVALPFGGAGAQWAHLLPTGIVVYGTDESIAAVDLLTGSLVWANVAYGALSIPRAWLLENDLIVEDRGGSLRRVDVVTGALSGGFERPIHGRWDPVDLRDLHSVDDTIFARYAQRLISYDPMGRILGADMIQEERSYEFLLAASDRMIAISAHQSPDPVVRRLGPDRTGSFHYRLYELAADGRLLREPVELPELDAPIHRAALIDGWVLCSFENRTIAIPYPIE